MEKFLNAKMEDQLKKITLDYTFKKEIILNNEIKRFYYATEIDHHCNILKRMMESGIIEDDSEAWMFLLEEDIFFAARRMAELGDMIFHISRNDIIEFYIAYLPANLTEYQKYRLRLWHEYLSKNKKEYNIQGPTGETTFQYEKGTSVLSYLEEQSILNDNYIRTLAKKFETEK